VENAAADAEKSSADAIISFMLDDV